jgi:hypothetical protein
MLHLFCQKFKGPDYHRDECVKSNFSAGFVAISGMPGLYSESGNDINHVPVEVGPDLHLEPGEQVRTVVKEDTFHDAEIKLDDNFHIDKANINVVPSEMASCSEDPLLCQSLLEKSSEPLSAEEDEFDCRSAASIPSKGSQDFDRLDEEQLMSMFADIEPFHKQQNPSNQSASNHTPAALSTALDNRCSERQTISENPSMP